MSKKSPTYAERLAAGLIAMGFKEVPSKSKKYREFRQEKFRNYYVGKAGALRAGDSASGSWSMGDPNHQNNSTYKTVLRDGDRLLALPTEPTIQTKLRNSGQLTACDSAALATVAESDPLLARALQNL